MARIDYYFSVLSPFTYLAGNRLEMLAERCGAEVVYKPMDILKLFAETGGVPVPKRHWSRQEYRLQELKRGSAAADLPLTLKPAHWPTDPVPASAAVMVAADHGAEAGRLAQAFLRAIWAEEKDIAEPAVVAESLSLIGLDAKALGEDLGRAADRVAQNTAEALAAGVFGSPFYIVDGERFWGADRLPALETRLGTL
ncbi:MAG: 2-hydroxychromene-2-carboxylate isomerase [Pseudomonadota bacterium]